MVLFRYMLILLMSIFVTKTSLGQDKYWYKTFTGTIDKYPVTFHLHKADHSVSGYYYYNKIQRPFPVSGADTTAGKLFLFSSGPDRDTVTESFTLSFQGDSLTGEWKKNYNAEAPGLPVKAVVSNTLIPAFDLIFISGTEKLRPKMAESPAASFEACAVWPKGNSPAVIALKKMINESMGFPDTSTDIGPLMLTYKKTFFKEYLSDNIDVPDSEFVQFPSAYNQDISDRITVVYHSGTILSIGHMSYAYTGGAHGNYGARYICVNPSTGKAYTLSMVLSATGRKQLKLLLEKNFRKIHKLSSKEPLTEAGLFENKIEPNDNFYLTGTGITFSYTPYEIGPWAMGEIEIFIPFSDFGAGGLNSSFKK